MYEDVFVNARGFVFLYDSDGMRTERLIDPFGLLRWINLISIYNRENPSHVIEYHSPVR